MKKNIFKTGGISLFLVLAGIFASAVPLSCNLTEEGIEIVEGDTVSPTLEKYNFENRSLINLEFSEGVNVDEVSFVEAEAKSIHAIKEVSYNDEKTNVKIHFENPTEIGTKYELSGTISDSKGNSSTFSIPFTGFNDNPAFLLLSEVRSESSTSNKEISKAEFVEFVVLKSGNTAGLELFWGSNEEASYVFPKIDVKRGDYITVHLRTETSSKCVDELEDDLTLSVKVSERTSASNDEARDLWKNSTESVLSKSDVLLLKDEGRNKIIDAVLFSESGKENWYYKGAKNYSEKAFSCGVWKNGFLPEMASSSDNSSTVRTLCRFNLDSFFEEYSEALITDETVISASKDDWFVVEEATPGSKNKNVKYVKE